MTQALVSIVCTVYNKAAWLEQTIDSFLSQETDFLFDIFLIDDCSTDYSREIIKDYATRYPERIHAYFNTENLGIAATWVKICNEVSAPYLARCDGDDYWTDKQKLQQQVDFLRLHPESRWCSTDIDYVDEKGQLIGRAIFESAQVKKAHDFEQMLVTRGFTAPSTWLVETELMKEVNHELALDTADDTFDLQLDLFQRTPLLYLPKSTVAYRINQGSDSRPKDIGKIEQRFNKLLETQKTYLEKYPASDRKKMLGLLLERSNAYELALTRHSLGLEDFSEDKVTVYIDKGQGFSPEESQTYPLDGRSLVFPIEEGMQKLRIDLSEHPSVYPLVSLESKRYATRLVEESGNGFRSGEGYLFPTIDPQLVFDVRNFVGDELVLTYQVDKNAQPAAAVVELVSQALKEARRASRLEMELANCQEERLIAQQQYQMVIGSRRWTIPTKIINFFRRKK